jgi:2,6-dihydroxypyridine 3-monooxygenase
MDQYHLGTSVTGFRDEGSEVTAFLSNGETKKVDLLVCADGINSTARRLLVPNASPEYAGYVAWRGTIAPENVAAETFNFLQESITYHLMPDGHLLSYPIWALDRVTAKRKRLINWLWYRNAPAGDDLNGLLTDRDGVRRDTSLAYKDLQEKHVENLRYQARIVLPPMFKQLVVSTEEPFIQAIFDGVIPAMAFGRICIMGDAAFAARPHCGAGTVKAAEDAWQLGNTLAKTGNDVVSALQQWEKRQLQCGQQLVDRAREIGNQLQFENSWMVGQEFPFGLYKPGDSVFQSGTQNTERWVAKRRGIANSR